MRSIFNEIAPHIQEDICRFLLEKHFNYSRYFKEYKILEKITGTLFDN